MALVGGDHQGQFAPSVCFGARMLLWDSFLSKDTVGQGLKPGNAQSHIDLHFFPLYFWPEEIPEGWGELPPSIWGA